MKSPDRFDRAGAERAVRALIRAWGEDPTRPDLSRTPERVALMWEEILSGAARDPGEGLKLFPYEGFDEIVLLKDISFHSICEHHLLPFFGRVHLAYIPRKSMIAGLSSLARVVEVFSRRLQVQERMTTEIADLLMERLGPRGVLVQVEAEHLCLAMRGEKKTGVTVKTQALRGIFRRDSRTRAEALSLLGNG